MAVMNDTDERLKEIVELTRLYDVYGPLLSDHSKNIFESYVLDNYSLSEIAEAEGISRQGVRDIVVRYSKKLYEYEEKLRFLEKLDKAAEEIEKIEKMLDDDAEVRVNFEKLKSIIEE